MVAKASEVGAELSEISIREWTTSHGVCFLLYCGCDEGCDSSSAEGVKTQWLLGGGATCM